MLVDIFFRGTRGAFYNNFFEFIFQVLSAVLRKIFTGRDLRGFQTPQKWQELGVQRNGPWHRTAY